jgi:hypothetical protein
MPTVFVKQGTLRGFSASTNLNSLANNQAKPLGIVDNTGVKYPNAYVYLSFNATQTLEYDGTIELYFVGCIDTSNDKWADNINPSTTSNVSASIINTKMITPLVADEGQSNEAIVWVCNDLAKEVGDLPPKWTLVVYNKSGQALKASGHRAVYQLTSYTS